MSEALLEVDGLRTWFATAAGEARAVDGVSFRIEEGESLGVVGESGCGKTVTALSLLGLVPEPPGRILHGSSIRWRGRELVGAPPEALRRVRGGEIAMVFQEPMTSLNPVLRVGRQIGEALRLHRGARGKSVRARAVSLLREVGIPDPEETVDAYPHALSGGMRQRVMIAMALAGDPGLLVADEPTTALDVTVQAQILDLLDRLRRDRGMALLLVSHDLGVVSGVCDRVAVMYAGRIVEIGASQRIFDAPVHPYTRALLASVPTAERRKGRLRAIEGSVPDAGAWPEGCRFRPRCPHGWERCGEEPELLAPEDGGPGGAARCWLVEEPGRREEG